MSGNSKGLILVGVFILGVLFALSFKKDEVESHAVAQDHSKADPQIALRQRGAYLMTITGCNDCHTPRDEKGTPIAAFYLAGHPANAPLPTWNPEIESRWTSPDQANWSWSAGSMPPRRPRMRASTIPARAP